MPPDSAFSSFSPRESNQPDSRRTWHGGWGRSVALLLCLAGCASRPAIVLPEGRGLPFPEFEATLHTAVDQCRRVRTMELSMAISGRTGDSTLRGDVLGALARPGSVRLVGVAPFGAPAFELVVRSDEAILLLPRERQFVRGASARALLGAVAGLPLEAEDFRALLTGCVVPDPRAVSGRAYPDGWVGIEVEGAARVYVRDVNGDWVVAGGSRPDLQVEYSDHVRGLPRRVHVVATDASGTTTDLTARLSQVSINIDLHPDVFVAEVGADYVPLTLEQFRRSAAPLRPSPTSSGPPP